MIEVFTGSDGAIEGDRNDGTAVLKLRFPTADHIQQPKLKAMVAKHPKAFQGVVDPIFWARNRREYCEGLAV